MIFEAEMYCACAKTAELDGTDPVQLVGAGLWVGVLSRGVCRLQGCEVPGRSGDVLLGAGPLALVPESDCHLLAVRLTGYCADAYLLRLGAPRWADGASCPGAAELVAQLQTADSAAMAYALLCAIAKADETARPLPPLVSEAVTAIRQNYMALYGVEELSEQLGVTKSHLVRTFKQALGVPPGKYLTTVRIEAVKTLLLTDEHNLEMIAGLTGFSGANYLCRVFKREVGVSPAAWRAAAAPPPAVPKLPPRSEEMFV
ncbi:AraC family transcriptional regulator [uncultured Subdoligranulum sp.]|uniref:helix-turn-helix domain-containing protein n=1 Tax=uncultured Subdoligranulum sp. TaxID=512298 RepID=UPI00261C26C2|nr:AraC family transcriptional regulator [uncultured Subdoligranulum sp.]